MAAYILRRQAGVAVGRVLGIGLRRLKHYSAEARATASRVVHLSACPQEELLRFVLVSRAAGRYARSGIDGGCVLLGLWALVAFAGGSRFRRSKRLSAMVGSLASRRGATRAGRKPQTQQFAAQQAVVMSCRPAGGALTRLASNCKRATSSRGFASPQPRPPASGHRVGKAIRPQVLGPLGPRTSPPRRPPGPMLWAAAILAGIVLSAPAIHAQPPRPAPAPGPGPRVIELKAVQLSGTVVGAQPGLLLVDTPTLERWALQVPGDTVVRVTGSAVPEVLCPGLYVRFLVRVDERRSRALSKVSRLVIITPGNMEGREPGVFPAQPDPNAAQRPEGGQGAGPEGGRAGQEQPPGQAELPGDLYDVRGQIRAIRGRWMTVFAPNTFFEPELRVELAPELSVMVDVSAYGLARPGDKFAALALQVGQQAAIARELVIALSEPVGQQAARGGRQPAQAGSPQAGSPAPAEPRQPGQPAGVAQAPGAQPPEGGEAPRGEVPGGQPAPEQTEAAKQALKIVELLRLKPAELEGKSALQVGFDGGEPVVFLPARPEAVKTIRDRFGPPEKIQSASGTLPLGEGGQQVQVQWNLWTYGPLRFFVDEVGTVRYYILQAAQPAPAEPEGNAPPQP